MNVYFLRHGKAQASSSTGRDEDRELTPEGREILEALGRVLKELRLGFHAILSSPYRRAVESARAVYVGMGSTTKPETARELASGATLSGLLDLLAGFSENDSILLVGHMPDLSEIAGELLAAGGPIPFKTGTLCGITIDGPVRRDVRASVQLFLHPEAYLSLAGRISKG
jgi:phosphohistidine phosphatase